MVRTEDGGRQPGTWRRNGVGGCELCLRVGSALVLVPLAVGSAYLGGPPFLAVWALAAAIILWEWTVIVGEPGRTPVLAAGAAAFASAAVLFGLGWPRAALAVLALGAVAVAGLAGSGRRAWILAGGVYAGVMLAAPAVLRSDAELGLLAVMLLFGVVWTTDVMAYFVGRALAGPKLWPAVSPKKTWSGAVGGAAAATVVGSGLSALAGLDHLAALALVCALLSLAAQTGDLLESALKRRFGAKNASELIPGHGGLMDRLDGFVAAALVATLLGLARGGFDAPARGLLIW
ncbi:MAG: phosphatidate cytidylyltransferase [Alphaproteobacteria bacterium]|nr:MAG: phosphatidate cytidylyltransferase [Alphaproteobacteria bacterium]